MNMKKKLDVPIAMMAVLSFSSCYDNSKVCYCYENRVEQEVYVSHDMPCSNFNTEKRGCIESHERGTFDPSSTAYK